MRVDINNFDDVFKVWVAIEGETNYNDHGAITVYGIHAGSSPKNREIVEILLTILDPSKPADFNGRTRRDVALQVARDYLKENYWDVIKNPNPTEKLLTFFYKRAWVCPYSRNLDFVSLGVQVWFSVDEFALNCSASSNGRIGYKGVRHRVETFNKNFGPQIAL